MASPPTALAFCRCGVVRRDQQNQTVRGWYGVRHRAAATGAGNFFPQNNLSVDVWRHGEPVRALLRLAGTTVVAVVED